MLNNKISNEELENVAGGNSTQLQDFLHAIYRMPWEVAYELAYTSPINYVFAKAVEDFLGKYLQINAHIDPNDDFDKYSDMKTGAYVSHDDAVWRAKLYVGNI